MPPAACKRSLNEAVSFWNVVRQEPRLRRGENALGLVNVLQTIRYAVQPTTDLSGRDFRLCLARLIERSLASDRHEASKFAIDGLYSRQTGLNELATGDN